MNDRPRYGILLAPLPDPVHPEPYLPPPWPAVLVALTPNADHVEGQPVDGMAIVSGRHVLGRAAIGRVRLVAGDQVATVFTVTDEVLAAAPAVLSQGGLCIKITGVVLLDGDEEVCWSRIGGIAMYAGDRIVVTFTAA